ncbi:hypothetical protein N8987_00240 [Crocinitomix sp.]|nr:hypothetical protein [Crocinitomix sp.]
MNTILFATSIKKEKDALNIANLLQNYFGIKSASFDLTDQHNILRVKGVNIIPKKIEQTLMLFGYKSKELL